MKYRRGLHKLEAEKYKNEAREEVHRRRWNRQAEAA
jgi:hypothetical protein